MSPFVKVRDVTVGLQKLENDLASGAWAKRNRAILGASALDVGYVLISAKVRKG